MRDVRTQQPELRAVVDAARSALADTDHSAAFSLGEVVHEWSSPTTVIPELGKITLLQLAADTRVWLPPVTAVDVGRTVTIKNNTDNTSTITIQAPVGGTIDGGNTYSCFAARLCLVLVVVGVDAWAILARYQ
jgi:hypothetical protein